MLDIKTIEAMRVAGIEFAACIRAPGGAETIFLEPEQVAAYIADRDQFAANEHGVPKEKYLEWIEHHGTPRCSGTTVKGEPCRKYMSGYSQLPLQEWLKRDGGYCATHGGDGSADARAKGFGSEPRWRPE